MNIDIDADNAQLYYEIPEDLVGSKFTVYFKIIDKVLLSQDELEGTDSMACKNMMIEAEFRPVINKGSISDVRPCLNKNPI
jgi:hypothetical protein